MTDQEVLGRSYCGEPPGGFVPQTQGDQVKTLRKFTNACMLVYIRDTVIGEVLAPLTQEDIPKHLCKLVLGWWSKISGSFSL